MWIKKLFRKIDLGGVDLLIVTIVSLMIGLIIGTVMFESKHTQTLREYIFINCSLVEIILVYIASALIVSILCFQLFICFKHRNKIEFNS